jgi:hypothetical protein
MLLAALAAFAQDKQPAGQNPPGNEPPSQSPAQIEPPSSQPAPPPVASSSKTISGTVESLTEGKSMKIKTAEGKLKTFALKDAAVDPGVKVGSAVRISQSRDVNGRGSITVELDQAEKH